MMNLRMPFLFPATRRLYAALLALVLFSAAAARAEEGRWLFVFNTSADMKKRLTATEGEIKTLLKTDFAGKLNEGDSIGVWTFADKLQMGKFPLVTWEPWHAGQLATNLMDFIQKQSYSGNTSFDSLQPTLNSVIEDSERLTVVILCDGEDEIHGTPYDEGLNETLKQTRDDRKKLRLPYVIIFRTQLGKYIGATVNFPPVAANLPPFPLLPREIKTLPPPPPVVVTPPPPPPPAAPLVIVGTHVSSDTNDVAKYLATNQVPAAPENPVATSPPAPVVPAPVTPAPAPTPVVSIPPAPTPAPPVVVTPAPAAVPIASAPAPAPITPPAPLVANVPASAPTNPATATRQTPEELDTRILTYVGVGLLGAAVALVIFLIFVRRPAPNQSLITSSMHNDPRPPEQK